MQAEGLEQQSPKFALEGFHSYLCRRSDQSALEESIAEIKNQGGLASGELIDATRKCD